MIDAWRNLGALGTMKSRRARVCVSYPVPSIDFFCDGTEVDEICE